MHRALVKLIYLWTFLAVCSACGVAQQSWMLQRSDGVWLKFSKQSEWQKSAMDSQPLETAAVNRTKTSISVIYDIQAASGDWRNIDRYLFRPSGNLLKLSRTFASVAQDIKLTQEYELDSSGKLKKIIEKEVSLNSGKPKKEMPEKPQIPIAINLRELAFMKAAN
jgi:hypothetical protein